MNSSVLVNQPAPPRTVVTTPAPTSLTDCTNTTPAKLARVNFFNRQLLTADDMITDRDYFLAKLRRHNRFMHGCGVVCGLIVAPAPITAQPWRVSVSSGYALGPYGDEIFVGETVYFDLAQCPSSGMTSPCEPSVIVAGAAGSSSTVYLAIKYAECLARPVQVAGSGCGCDNDPCQYSRILDSFQIQCLQQPPAQTQPPITLCQAMQNPVLLTCPPCPTTPWVILATITLPSSTSMNVATTNIDNVTLRQVLLSTSLIQKQVYNCCCGQTTPPPPGTLAVNQTWSALSTAGASLPVTSATVSINVTNNGTSAANITVTVLLSQSGTEPATYEVTPGTGWVNSPAPNLTTLTSQPFNLAAGATTSTPLTFQVAEIPSTGVVSFNLTSNASASAPGFTTANATPITIPFGSPTSGIS